MIQTIPAPSHLNTCFRERQNDRDYTFLVMATYDAGGPRFKSVEEMDMSRIGGSRFDQDHVRRRMWLSATEQIKQDIAAHLAIINPIDND